MNAGQLSIGELKLLGTSSNPLIAPDISLSAAKQLLQEVQSIAIQDPTAALSNAYVTYAAPVFVPARGLSVPGSDFKAYIEHQPLIQIKLRVVEVIRDDTLNAGVIAGLYSSAWFSKRV